ncbi:Transcription factor atf1 [Fusarium oxysporum f. sp. albedinis]|nr:Transcription factor atf1 [Fusarium oxysporum f. sp. albedinis]
MMRYDSPTPRSKPGPTPEGLFEMNNADAEQTTPTGKVSRAKKGKPVHVYTRAEHLRRHQSSHREPKFQCPICQRCFYRKDLLERHYKRHEGETD